MVIIKEINEPSEKSQIVKNILQELPEWFGIEEATQWYIDDAKASECLVALDENERVGFVTLSNTSEDCVEIVCMGVLPSYHRKGIGKQLMKAAEKLMTGHYHLIQVKTVDEGHYEQYDVTNQFYRCCGFKKLEVFPTLWDEHNPCLVWVKSLPKSLS